MKRNLCLLLFFFLISGCGGHTADYLINVSRSQYQPQTDPAKYLVLKGKTVSFYSVNVTAGDVSNFNYYSVDYKIGYNLFYESGKLRQPVASYFWYTLEKSLQHIGMDVTPDGPMTNVPVMVMTITTLTDSEAVFRIRLTKNDALLFEKTLTVTQRLSPTSDFKELEQRSYLLLDAITEKIISDEDFQKAFSG